MEKLEQTNSICINQVRLELLDYITNNLSVLLGKYLGKTMRKSVDLETFLKNELNDEGNIE